MADFATTDAAMTQCGVAEAEKSRIYGIVAAVLHLGNIRFESNEEDNRGGCSVVEEAGGGDNEPLHVAAALLGVAPEELREALTSRVMQTAKGGFKGRFGRMIEEFLLLSWWCLWWWLLLLLLL